MTNAVVLLLALAAPAADSKDQDAKKPAPAAKVTITAELACLHCTFGQGDGCAVCLALDDKTPVVLEGKAAKPFEDQRLSKKVVVAEGTLTLNKDKRLVLTADEVHAFDDKDKGKAPEKGLVRVVGTSCCAHCDLGIGDTCGVAIKNATFPLVLDGKPAQQHAEEGKEARTATATGKLSVDKNGNLRLDTKELTLKKDSK